MIVKKKNPTKKTTIKKILASRHFYNGWVLHGSDSQGAAATEFNSLTAFSAEDTQNTYRVRIDGSFRMTCVLCDAVHTTYVSSGGIYTVQCTSVKLHCMVRIVLTS